MGFGRFGVGGCCLCSPENPDDPGGSSERAGPCGWCGEYDPNEINLDMPVPPEKLCERFVFDNFEYSKDYPRVPYWTWQRDQPGDDWNEKWLYGDYHHLDNGHFVNSGRGRYKPNNNAPWRPVFNKLVDTFCKGGNQADGGKLTNYSYKLLTNLPPMYGNNGGFAYDYPYRYENGIIINSQSNKTDLLPLKQSVSLSFNTPRNQFPKWFWQYNTVGTPVLCFEPPCIFNQQIAAQRSWLKSDYEVCIDGGTVGGSPFLFVWNYPGSPNSGGYGLKLRHFVVASSMTAPVDYNFTGMLSTAPYIPTQQWITIDYYLGEYGSQMPVEGGGDAYFPMPYKDSFNLEVEVQFGNWPSDNRKCLLTVNFLIDGAIVFTKQHIIAKPGWRQDGSPSDEQSYIQSFCPGQIDAWNEITGVNNQSGSTSPWYRETVAMWDTDQTPRESFWLDSWWAEYVRLNP